MFIFVLLLALLALTAVAASIIALCLDYRGCVPTSELYDTRAPRV